MASSDQRHVHSAADGPGRQAADHQLAVSEQHVASGLLGGVLVLRQVARGRASTCGGPDWVDGYLCGWDVHRAVDPARKAGRVHRDLLRNQGLDGFKCGTLYKGQIAPVVNTTIAGVVWYQGENNVRNVAGSIANRTGYACQMASMIEDWRSIWSAVPNTTDPQFPFGVTQLAGSCSEGFPQNSGAFRRAGTIVSRTQPCPTRFSGRPLISEIRGSTDASRRKRALAGTPRFPPTGPATTRTRPFTRGQRNLLEGGWRGRQWQCTTPPIPSP
eukprot:m.364475 g.364475  ORF g.364475 m.364475 type:complete len:272 (-) comp16654_c0_seq68:536-1351(-)